MSVISAVLSFDLYWIRIDNMKKNKSIFQFKEKNININKENREKHTFIRAKHLILHYASK